MFRYLPYMLLAASLPCAAQGASAGVTQAGPTPSQATWTASWATSVQGPEQSQPGVDPARETDATIRQIVHLSVGGSMVRVQFSNAFGTKPLLIDAAAVALATSPAASSLVPGSSHTLLFGGKPSVLIPVGATFVSDPVALPVAPLANLVISVHLPEAPSVESAHPGSRATSYLLTGNHVTDADLPGAEKVVRWMQIAEVDVTASAPHTVVALGDSITDGHAANNDANERWPDVLSAHLQSAGMKDVAVVNEGIGGNHLLTNGIGQSALERFDRDVLGVAGVRSVLVLEGINDLGMLGRFPNATPEMHTTLIARMEDAFTQIIERAHAHGIKVYGATITPDGGSGYYHPSPDDEAARQAVNAWIRQPGHFDAVVDFDAVVRDPAHPEQMLPAYDSGDHLHPGPAGYKAMGNAVPLNLFR
jgi:lysophospholipase L1-like esterase